MSTLVWTGRECHRTTVILKDGQPHRASCECGAAWFPWNELSHTDWFHTHVQPDPDWVTYRRLLDARETRKRELMAAVREDHDRRIGGAAFYRVGGGL